MHKKIFSIIFSALVAFATLSPLTAFAHNANEDSSFQSGSYKDGSKAQLLESSFGNFSDDVALNDFAAPSYEVAYTLAPTLTIDLDTGMLFEGAQMMIDVLSSPYLLIAGFGLGVAILSAIMKAVTHLRI